MPRETAQHVARRSRSAGIRPPRLQFAAIHRAPHGWVLKRARGAFSWGILLTSAALVALLILGGSKASAPWFVGALAVLVAGVLVLGLGERSVVDRARREIRTRADAIPFDEVELLEDGRVVEGFGDTATAFAQLLVRVRGWDEPVILAESVRTTALARCAVEIAAAIGVPLTPRGGR